MKTGKYITKRAKTLYKLGIGDNGALDVKKITLIGEAIRQSQVQDKIKILQVFARYVSRALARRTLTIESASNLDRVMVDQIVKTMSKKVGWLLEPKIVLKPELVSGVKVILYDTIYDYSLKGRFEQIKEKVG